MHSAFNLTSVLTRIPRLLVSTFLQNPCRRAEDDDTDLGAATDFLGSSSLFSRTTGCAELYRVFAPADDGGGLALGSEPEMQT